MAERQTYLLVDGENIDATLGTSILGRRPRPEERPRWDRLLEWAERAFDQDVTGLFFLAATTEMPISQPRSGLDTETIWPVSRPNLFAARPEYSDRHKMPRPRPNGMITAGHAGRARTATANGMITPRHAGVSAVDMPVARPRAGPLGESAVIMPNARARRVHSACRR